MVKHVDFESQVTAYLGNKAVRPDLVVNLSAERHIVVDAKVPFSSYLDALETSDPEEHAAYLRRHAHMVRTHVQQLSHKDYIEAFSPTPEFVVLFTPADPFWTLHSVWIQSCWSSRLSATLLLQPQLRCSRCYEPSHWAGGTRISPTRPVKSNAWVASFIRA